MRSIFGILSLLVVLAVVGLLAKKQLAGLSVLLPDLKSAASPSGQATPPQVSASALPAAMSEEVKRAMEEHHDAVESSIKRQQDAADQVK